MADVIEVPLAQDVFGSHYKRFNSIVEELRAANEVKKQAEEESKRLNKLLQEMWADVGAKTVVNDSYRVTLVSSSNSSISKEKLFEAGVSLAIIEKATKTTSFSYVKVSENKCER